MCEHFTYLRLSFDMLYDVLLQGSKSGVKAQYEVRASGNT